MHKDSHLQRQSVTTDDRGLKGPPRSRARLGPTQGPQCARLGGRNAGLGSEGSRRPMRLQVLYAKEQERPKNLLVVEPKHAWVAVFLGDSLQEPVFCVVEDPLCDSTQK